MTAQSLTKLFTPVSWSTPLRDTGRRSGPPRVFQTPGKISPEVRLHGFSQLSLKAGSVLLSKVFGYILRHGNFVFHVWQFSFLFSLKEHKNARRMIRLWWCLTFTHFSFLSAPPFPFPLGSRSLSLPFLFAPSPTRSGSTEFFLSADPPTRPPFASCLLLRGLSVWPPLDPLSPGIWPSAIDVRPALTAPTLSSVDPLCRRRSPPETRPSCLWSPPVLLVLAVFLVSICLSRWAWESSGSLYVRAHGGTSRSLLFVTLVAPSNLVALDMRCKRRLANWPGCFMAYRCNRRCNVRPEGALRKDWLESLPDSDTNPLEESSFGTFRDSPTPNGPLSFSNFFSRRDDPLPLLFFFAFSFDFCFFFFFFCFLWPDPPLGPSLSSSGSSDGGSSPLLLFFPSLPVSRGKIGLSTEWSWSDSSSSDPLSDPPESEVRHPDLHPRQSGPNLLLQRAFSVCPNGISSPLIFLSLLFLLVFLHCFGILGSFRLSQCCL